MIETIHYVWVGVPTKLDPNAVAGHDVIGPIKMAKQLEDQHKNGHPSYPIKYWCFKAHKDFYQTQFTKEHINIELCTIEDLVISELGHEELYKYAKFISDYLKKPPVTIQEKVQFKDCFSLFLLVSQAGYFFDTNVFPEQGKTVVLPGEETVTTARSGFQDTNDFFMMYSPKRADPIMIEIFKRWKNHPTFGNLSVFSVDGKRQPYFKNNMGVKKFSYKSYIGQHARSLFFWLETQPESLENYLKYGDVNHQETYAKSIKELEPFSLCYSFNGKSLLDIPFQTNSAYVQVGFRQMYYVNKSTNTVTLVYEELSTLFDIFPKTSTQIKLGSKQNLLTIVRAISTDNELTPDYPPYLINIKDCTLLHEAVLTNSLNNVSVLLKANAKFNLKARYEIKSEGKILDLTPRELAELLKYTQVATLLSFAERSENITQAFEAFNQLSIKRKNKLEKVTSYLQELSEKKQSIIDDRYVEMNKAIDAIVTEINNYCMQYINCEIDEEMFKKYSKKILTDSRDRLKHFPGWKASKAREVVINLLPGIFSIGIGYGIAAAVKGDLVLFKNDTTKILNKADSINKSVSNLSMELK